MDTAGAAGAVVNEEERGEGDGGDGARTHVSLAPGLLLNLVMFRSPGSDWLRPGLVEIVSVS